MIIAPPNHFEGSLVEYIDEYVVPNLAPADRLGKWIRAVLDYYSADDPIFIVRGPRKGELARHGGLRIAHSDNSPGIWCFVRALDGRFDPSDLPEAIESGQIPVLAALVGRDKRDWDWNYSTKALSSADSAPLWDVSLKHCHLLPVKKAPGVSSRQRAIRNICPANHFAFPNGWGRRHFVTERVGWSESAPEDLGESPLVIAWVRSRIEERLRATHARTYQRFLRVAGGGVDQARLVDRRIRIERVGAQSAPTHARNIGPPTVRSSAAAPAAPKVRPLRAPGPAVHRRWTLNLRHGYYVKTGETATVVELDLSVKDHRGAVSAVGRFILDLPQLVTEGVATERHGLYDVRIVHDRGRYYLGVRSTTRVPLDDYAVG